MTMYIKIHTHGSERIVAACDEDILGKTFRGDGTKITVHEEFYMGEQADEETLIQRLGLATIINLVGNETVAIAVREGFVSEGSVLDIGGVKHAQAVLLN